MITKISFKNFKSWKQVNNLKIGQITGLFGTNSSGKTSVIQSLLLMKQTVQSNDRALVLNFGDDRSLVNLGGFKDAIKDHDTNNNLHFEYEWTLPEPLNILDIAGGKKSKPLLSGKKINFSTTIEEVGSKISVKEMKYSFADNTFAMKPKSAKGDYTLSAEGTYQFTRSQGRVWNLPAPIKCYGFPDQVKAYYQNAQFLADLELSLEELFSRTFYLGPLREYPKRQYLWTGSDPSDMGLKGERAVDALLSAKERNSLISLGKGKPKVSLEEYVARWLKDLGLIHSFNVEAASKENDIYRVRVQKHPNSAQVLITDVGFGVSQVLPVLVLCFYAPIGSTIIFEQPEIHLHPSVQSGLADVFIDAIKKRNIQIIFESHSEHLLRRLQRRIAEEKLSSDITNLYFCDSADSGSSITHLDVDSLGNIKNWPKGFFGDDMEEIAQMTKAQLALRAKNKS